LTACATPHSTGASQTQPRPPNRMPGRATARLPSGSFDKTRTDFLALIVDNRRRAPPTFPSCDGGPSLVRVPGVSHFVFPFFSESEVPMSAHRKNGHHPATNGTATTPPAAGGHEGRDARGRFAPGNPGGPGNPFARRVAELRTALLDMVT